MPLIELAFWLVIPAGYATLVLVLARWIAHRSGLSSLVVALPLAVVPIVALSGRAWRHSWLFVVPVTAAVIVAAKAGEGPDWKPMVSAAFATGVVWIPVMSIIGSIVRAVSRKHR